LDGVINTDYTYFEFDRRINHEDAVKKITKEITKESFLYEKDIIKQELEDISYDQRIYEYVVKKYLDSDFSMNEYAKVSWEDIENYHKKYYQSENMIIVDDEFKILKQ
jgi:predicted Zn-dependent peptidase